MSLLVQTKTILYNLGYKSVVVFVDKDNKSLLLLTISISDLLRLMKKYILYKNY